MWKTIKKVVNGFCQLLGVILPTIYLFIMSCMIVIYEWDIGGIMFFIWLLVMFSTSEITDAIKESKEK